jgi:hypothetical protein
MELRFPVSSARGVFLAKPLEIGRAKNGNQVFETKHHKVIESTPVAGLESDLEQECHWGYTREESACRA